MKGYEAAPPRSSDHKKLDEESVRAHEESHAQDIVAAIENAVRAELNRPGVQQQFSVTKPCEHEQSAFERLHVLVGKRIQARGANAFEGLLRDFERHGTASATETKARKAQKTEFDNR